MAGLGLGYDTLKEINPGLVMVSITAFGQTGPYRDIKPITSIPAAPADIVGSGTRNVSR